MVDKDFMNSERIPYSVVITSFNDIMLVKKKSFSASEEVKKKLNDYCNDKRKEKSLFIGKVYRKGLKKLDIDIKSIIKENRIDIAIQNALLQELRKKGVINESQMITKELEERWKKEKYE